LNESTRDAYSTPSHEGVISNELFACTEKDHKGLNKYSIPSKLSLKATSIHVADISIKTARLPYFNSNLTTLQRSIVLCINGVDPPQISSSVFDTTLPARLIYDHVISPLFIATREWHE